MPQVIIVSNRLPVSVKRDKGKLVIYPSVGGLATALWSYTSDKGSKWIGWPGISIDETTEAERRDISKRLRAYNCYPVFLTKKQLADYYNGYSNGILWPLFHNLPAPMDHYERYWKSYKEINTLFADAVLALCRKQNTIWVHDYQMLLLPQLLRKDRPLDNIGLFLHIPFPPQKGFTKLPHAKHLLTGMLGADLVGFHTPSYTQHFIESCLEFNIGVPNDKNLVVEQRVIRITDFPISIDYAKYLEASSSLAVTAEVRKLKKRYGGRKIILTVDRLDPTKGLVQRLQAYKDLLQQNPHLHEHVVMVMLAVPSRTEIDAYKKLKKQVEKLITEINETYGLVGWIPVDYIYDSLPFEKVTALYKVADVAFITPLRDGMNLVAKEYIASKQNKKGVLILSETAGAAEELKSAIIVNPRKRSAMVAALNTAITMPQLELKERITVMQKQLSVNTVQKWVGNFMGTLQKSSKLSPHRTHHLSTQIRQMLVENYAQAKHRLILLDYDGTLTPFFDNPVNSKPTESLYNQLKKLSAIPQNEVVIVSGRDRTKLQEWFGDLPITLVAEHGYLVRKPGMDWEKRSGNALGWKKSVRAAMQVYADRTPGAFVEEKESALVWHYRTSPAYQAQKNMVILKRLLVSSLRGTGLRVYSGNKILEVKPKRSSKSNVLAEFAMGGEFVLALGDDYTDEDMFLSLPAYAFTIKVGPGRTNARYRLNTVDEVLKLLKKLV
jgi:trehalose 6-phosphate synthase/phosphatase